MNIPEIKLQTIIEKLNSIFLKPKSMIYDDDQLPYWKNTIFSVVSFFMILMGGPAFFLGALLFYAEGNVLLGTIEIAIYIGIIAVTTHKKWSIQLRVSFIILALYALSLLVLIFTGPSGAGMICVLFTLILAGLLLNKHWSQLFLVLNIFTFMVLTFLLHNQLLVNYAIHQYSGTWLMNALTTQISGAILLILAHFIYDGLEMQNNKIKLSKEIILNSEIRHKAMIENISDVIMVLDGDGVIQYASPNVTLRCGWPHQMIMGQPFFRFIRLDQHHFVQKKLNELLNVNISDTHFEAGVIFENGEQREFNFTASNLLDDPNVQGVLLNFHDITERRRREDEILYLMERDALTGLLNRHLMNFKIDEIDTAQNLPISIIYGDLNGLKMINDALGHQWGDQLLMAIAEILQSVSRQTDAVFRVGGDEFLMILPNTNSEAVDQIAQSIFEACDNYNQSSTNQSYFLSISLGVSTKENQNVAIEAVIKMAEEVMYRRKVFEEKSIHNSILLSMLKVLFEKSQETEEHAQRLVVMSEAIGKKMKLSSHELYDLELVAKLHDIGKIAIDSSILEKTTQLTEDDWIALRKHPEIGYRIAKACPELASAANYIYTHHEKWDGTGYPQGLKGTSIPLISRIVAVVDAYDAMTENRSYRLRRSQIAAVEEIIQCSGTQFDPEVVTAFICIIEDQTPIVVTHLENAPHFVHLK